VARHVLHDERQEEGPRLTSHDRTAPASDAGAVLAV